MRCHKNIVRVGRVDIFLVDWTDGTCGLFVICLKHNIDGVFFVVFLCISDAHSNK